MILEIDCNINCSECSRDCHVKDLFKLPEDIFNKTLIDSLKASAGIRICAGENPKEVEEDLIFTAVSFHFARKKFLEQ